NEQKTRPHSTFFLFAAEFERRSARPHFAFFPFAAVQMSNSRRQTAPGWHTKPEFTELCARTARCQFLVAPYSFSAPPPNSELLTLNS
ncbi:MAG: hypothetical protein IKI42_06385, partial [Clostridia bacterium]|nr:hypothetical protein [Clostridia bacterium]